MNRKDFYLRAGEVVERTQVSSITSLYHLKNGRRVGKIFYKPILELNIDYIGGGHLTLFSETAIETIKKHYGKAKK